MLGCVIVDLCAHQDHPHNVDEENSRMVQNAYQESGREANLQKIEQFED